jgi:tetratricopeptide (TPR) repeat protein
MSRLSTLTGLSIAVLAGLSAAANAASTHPLPDSATVKLVHAGNLAPADSGDWWVAEGSASPYAPAGALLARSLEDRERTLGKEHPFTLTTMNSLAAIYTAQGHYREAESLYKRAVEASERTLGKEHSLTQTSLKGLAAVYKAEGRSDEAERLYSQAEHSAPQSPHN